ncbi:MAG TPA: M56 family metallopeptidase [Blastocatellia bacterium]
MSLHEVLYEWSRWIWPLALNHLWQATIFSSLVFLVARGLKSGPARTRHAIWLAASLKFALPSAALIFLGGQLGLNIKGWYGWSSAATKNAPLIRQVADPMVFVATVNPAGGFNSANSGATAAHHNELYCLMTLIWAAGCLFFLGLWWYRRYEFSQKLKTGRVATTGREAEALRRVQARFGSVRVWRLLLLPGTTEPGVWRSWAPVVALPEELATHLSDQELEAVLIHELVHVSRRDNLISNLQMLLCCAFWFHPLVWLIDRRLLTERERTCDEKVIEMGTASSTYAASLLKVVRFCSGWRMAGVSSATGSNIQSRLSAIIASKCDSRPNVSNRLAVSVIAAAVVLFSLATGIFGRGATASNISRNCPASHYPVMMAWADGPAIAPSSDVFSCTRIWNLFFAWSPEPPVVGPVVGDNIGQPACPGDNSSVCADIAKCKDTAKCDDDQAACVRPCLAKRVSRCAPNKDARMVRASVGK